MCKGTIYAVLAARCKSALTEIQKVTDRPQRTCCAEYYLVEAEEYLYGSCLMLSKKRPSEAMALARWLFEAGVNLIWASMDENDIDTRQMQLLAEACRADKNMFEGMGELIPARKEFWKSKADCAGKAYDALKNDLPSDLKLPSMKGRIDGIRNKLEYQLPNLYPLYRVASTSVHANYFGFRRFKCIDHNQIVAIEPPDQSPMARWLICASTMYLLAGVYRMSGTDDEDDLKKWWEKDVVPLLQNE